MNEALAAAATSLIGVRFRLHGRDPATGLDCVGVVAEAMRRAGQTPVTPEGYRLRAVTVSSLLPFAEANGFEAVEPAESGDVVLAMANPVQPHLLIGVSSGYVHGNARLGRVTFLPGPAPWPLVGGWRLPIVAQVTGN